MRTLMGDLWTLYYGISEKQMWDGLDRYKDHEVIKVRQEQLMECVRRRYRDINTNKGIKETQK